MSTIKMKTYIDVQTELAKHWSTEAHDRAEFAKREALRQFNEAHGTNFVPCASAMTHIKQFSGGNWWRGFINEAQF